MKKLKETHFPLLNRTEVIFEIDHARQPTPRKDVIKKQLAAELKTNEELINLHKIINNFGSTKTKVIAEIYNTKEDLERLIKKNKKQEQQKKVKSEDGKEENKKQKA